ncbi:ATP-dependent DNA helicase PIF1-like [Senna tora]|uniref:ATP-dependent DNA helicase n=1 Tax=Senna tora TaxID=362788 RepID=A0A834SUE9_9FABA|nr:ATP-dependent DNA helicase PIF1-like [Senna tora]
MELRNFALIEIDKLLRNNERTLMDFPPLPVPNGNSISNLQNQLILDKLNFDKEELAVESAHLISKMTNKQKYIFYQIMHSTSTPNGGVFFVHGYGGTGKTYIWRALTATLRAAGHIVLTVASSAVDKSLRDILQLDNPNSLNIPFGGKAIVLAGDFRQILPNMRLRSQSSSHNEDEVKEFAYWLLNVGEGKVNEPNDGEVEIEIPNKLLITDFNDPIAAIISSTYPSLQENYINAKYLKDRTILAPTLEIVEEAFIMVQGSLSLNWATMSLKLKLSMEVIMVKSRMASSEKVDPISAIHPDKETWKIRARVGRKIQVSITLKELVNKYLNQLVEGQSYKFQNFNVAHYIGEFRPTKHNYRINFNGATGVQPCESAAIPLYAFDFVPIADIIEKKNDEGYLVGNKQHVKCVLFGDYAQAVHDYMMQSIEAIVVVILQLARVKEFKEKRMVVVPILQQNTSSDHSKEYNAQEDDNNFGDCEELGRTSEVAYVISENETYHCLTSNIMPSKRASPDDVQIVGLVEMLTPQMSSTKPIKQIKKEKFE